MINNQKTEDPDAPFPPTVPYGYVYVPGADSTTAETHTAANMQGRSNLLKLLRALRSLPGCENVRLLDVKTETAVRETFRIDGVYKMTHQDYVEGKIFEDAISHSFYPIDLHREGKSIYQEFLSKYDHKPFTTEEYLRLNNLLADPQLPLGNVAFEVLIRPSEKNDDQPDAVSGATSREIADFVVEGAAYTTYTLWNIVYGPAQALVREVTEQEMTPKLLVLILNSPVAEDKIWALKRINVSTPMDRRLENAVLDIIGGDDFFAAYCAIDALKPVHLHSESLQLSLFSKYEAINHSLKKQLFEKLKEAPKISRAVVGRSREILQHLNGAELGNLFALYRQHGVQDVLTCRAVAGLLQHDNAFISKKAYQYLSVLNVKDEVIIKALDRYRSKQN